jgi:hypothetical protein
MMDGWWLTRRHFPPKSPIVLDAGAAMVMAMSFLSNELRLVVLVITGEA